MANLVWHRLEANRGTAPKVPVANHQKRWLFTDGHDTNFRWFSTALCPPVSA